jgi:hypothetical protein
MGIKSYGVLHIYCIVFGILFFNVCTSTKTNVNESINAYTEIKLKTRMNPRVHAMHAYNKLSRIEYTRVSSEI